MLLQVGFHFPFITWAILIACAAAWPVAMFGKHREPYGDLVTILVGLVDAGHARVAGCSPRIGEIKWGEAVEDLVGKLR